MTSHRDVIYLILFTTLTLNSAAPLQAQQRSNSPRQSHNPPQVDRPEPQRQQQGYEPENRRLNDFRSVGCYDWSVGCSNVNNAATLGVITPTPGYWAPGSDGLVPCRAGFSGSRYVSLSFGQDEPAGCGVYASM
jgi:hypothetical protein